MTFQKIFQVVKLASQGGLNSVDIASQKLQILGCFDNVCFYLNFSYFTTFKTKHLHYEIFWNWKCVPILKVMVSCKLYKTTASSYRIGLSLKVDSTCDQTFLKNVSYKQSRWFKNISFIKALSQFFKFS